MLVTHVRSLLVLLVLAPALAPATEYNIRDYGAKPDDDGDDTRAVLAALEACGRAGGGSVFVPAGTYLISRQGAESPILPLPPRTTLRGAGPASVLKFGPRVNESNFWRLLGAAPGECRHVTVRDLRLDGSTTARRYDKGKTPEHNHGVFFSAPTGLIEDVTLRDLLVENFSGDCVAVGQGCRNVTIRDVKVRNFIRQGIQLAGGNGARDYLVTGCQDLEPTVEAGGSTIHVEHARGLTNVTIAANHCRRSLMAGGVDGLIIRDNHVQGRLVGNGNRNLLVQGNVVRGPAGHKAPVVQLGYTDGLVLRDNLVIVAGEGQSGIYVWGSSKYNPDPSRDVMIAGNVVRPADPAERAEKGIILNGVEGGLVTGNRLRAVTPIVTQRAKGVTVVEPEGEAGAK